MQKFYTLAEFARIVGHDITTVKDKIQRGKVKTVPVVNGLNRRNTYILSESELRKYMETYCTGLTPKQLDNTPKKE